MRAIELRIVFEDDEGKTFATTYRSGDPRIAHRLDEAVRGAIRDVDPEARGLSSVGPVLRKVTEATAAWLPSLHAIFPSGRGCEQLGLNQLMPINSEAKRMVFRFDVTAAPAPEVKP